MVGRPLEKVFSELEKKSSTNDVLLKVSNFTGRGFRNASFTLNKGEVVGFYGLVGAGRTELLRAVFGVDEKLAGEIELEGKKVDFNTPGEAVKAGVGFLTEDRKYQGIFPEQGVKENISVVCLKDLKDFCETGLKKIEGITGRNSEEAQYILRNTLNYLNM